MTNLISSLLSFDENRATVNELIDAVNAALIANEEDVEVVALVKLTVDESGFFFDNSESYEIEDGISLAVTPFVPYEERKFIVAVFYTDVTGEPSAKFFANK